MNERIKELYKSCRSKEALASQEQFQSANLLLGTEVEKFAELIVRECISKAEDYGLGCDAVEQLKVDFGVE